MRLQPSAAYARYCMHFPLFSQFSTLISAIVRCRGGLVYCRVGLIRFSSLT